MEVTGFFFHTTQKGKQMVGYSTLTSQGRFMSWHDRTGMSEEQAKCAFHIEHDKEVRHLLSQRKQKGRIIQTN